jgi:DNA-binding NtrC family response regulator
MGQANHTPLALVVEDDSDVRHLAAALLEETDLFIIEASSAEEALHFLQDHAAGVAFAFIDVRLPCLMDGVDLARTISLKWPWIRLVVTSGAADASLSHLPRNATYMPKPWLALDVLMEAERALRDAKHPREPSRQDGTRSSAEEPRAPS